MGCAAKTDWAYRGGTCPQKEIRAVAGTNDFVWRPRAERELMGHDSRPGREVAPQLRFELGVHARRQVQRHYRCARYVGVKQIGFDERHSIGELDVAGHLQGHVDQPGIQLDADASRPVLLRCQNRNPSVAGPEVVDHVASACPRQLQHLVRHGLRRRHEVHIGLACGWPWHRPEQQRRSIRGMTRLVRPPIPDSKGARHDSRAKPQFAPELHLEPLVHARPQVHRDDGRLRDVLIE